MGGRRSPRGLRLAIRVNRVTGTFSNFVSLAALALLATSILVIAAARLMYIPLNVVNQLALWAGVWLAMVGAAYTEKSEGHVSAGISIERFVRGPAKALIVGLRVFMITSFLLLITVTASIRTWGAFIHHEKSLDVLGWPIWPGLLAIPVGALAWFIIYVTPSARRGEHKP